MKSMSTIESIRNSHETNEAIRLVKAMVRDMQENMEKLENAYRTYRFDGTVRDSIDALIREIGYTAAADTIATAVNGVSKYDGRIRESVRSWAEAQEGAFDNELCDSRSVHTDIHPANLNQIAELMSRTEAPVEDEPEEAAATAAASEEAAAEEEELRGIEIDRGVYDETIRKAEQLGTMSTKEVMWRIDMRACTNASRWDYSIGRYGAYVEVTPDELTAEDRIEAAREYIEDRRSSAAQLREHARSGLFGSSYGNARWMATAKIYDACAATAETILAELTAGKQAA